jgi:hypothetical protein
MVACEVYTIDPPHCCLPAVYMSGRYRNFCENAFDANSLCFVLACVPLRASMTGTGRQTECQRHLPS